MRKSNWNGISERTERFDDSLVGTEEIAKEQLELLEMWGTQRGLRVGTEEIAKEQLEPAMQTCLRHARFFVGTEEIAKEQLEQYTSLLKKFKSKVGTEEIAKEQLELLIGVIGVFTEFW